MLKLPKALSTLYKVITLKMLQWIISRKLNITLFYEMVPQRLYVMQF